MKRNTRKLFALVLALAMVLVSLPAVALAEEIDLGGEIVIDEGTVIDVDTQGEEGELEIEMDEGEGLPDGAIDPEGGEDLNLGLDLDGEGLETLEGEELAPVTEEAMNDGGAGTTPATAFVIEDLNKLRTAMSNSPGELKRSDGETAQKPTYYGLSNPVNYQSGDSAITVASDRHVVLDLAGFTITMT